MEITSDSTWYLFRLLSLNWTTHQQEKPYCPPKVFHWVNFFFNVNITLIFRTNQNSIMSANTEHGQSLKILLIYSVLVNNCRSKVNLLYKNCFFVNTKIDTISRAKANISYIPDINPTPLEIKNKTITRRVH